jgi:hypothetical protein
MSLQEGANEFKVCDGFIVPNETINMLYEKALPLTKDEILERLILVYKQSVDTKKNYKELIECFIINDFNVLNTLKTLYTSKINQNSIETHKPKSINQLRMSEIRKYMSQRDKLINDTKKQNST